MSHHYHAVRGYATIIAPFIIVSRLVAIGGIYQESSMAAIVTGKFIYFAYGSNMFTRRIAARVPSAIFSGTGYIRERRLTFNKVSIDGSGKCDIEGTANPNDLVYGVLFEIDSNEKGELDRAEGL